jgi:hypothetical protein
MKATFIEFSTVKGKRVSEREREREKETQKNIYKRKTQDLRYRPSV